MTSPERGALMRGLNHESRRLDMVEMQIRARGVSDPLVLAAMRRVPRHLFVPEDCAMAAYDDRPLPIGQGQTISQPYMVASMTQSLKLGGQEKVLEIGTGSGYQSAILAEIAERVVTVERKEDLQKHAARLLRELGYANIEAVVGDGSKGYPAGAPYDAIIVTAGAPGVPEALVEQLAVGGRLVIPVGNSFHQTLTRVTRAGDGVETESLEGCVFVPLIGEYGWDEHESN
jgi:protein-L-isoaspartate(D-aspartate) O-methyltransferase